MQIILVASVARLRWGFPFSTGFLATCAALLMVTAITWAFMLGMQEGYQEARETVADTDDGTSKAKWVLHWQNQLAMQRHLLAVLTEETRHHLDTLAVQLGKVRARSLRIEALGAHLVDVAKIDEIRFDLLASPPGLGGTENHGEHVHGQNTFLRSLIALDTQLGDQAEKLQALQSLLLDADLQQAQRPTGKPVKGAWLSSRFGTRIDPFTGKPAHHAGVDFSGQPGTPVLAVADGLVTWSGYRPNYGNTIDLYHGDGMSTRYAHNKRNLVAVGSKVDKGQIIAMMGSTGRSTGTHLHFEVLQHGKAIDPMKMLEHR